MIEDRGSKIEDRRSRIAPSPVKRFSILDPRSSILDHLRYPDLSLPPVVVFVATDFAARKRSVFQPVGDAVLLVLLASVNAWRIPAVATDFAARVVKLAVEPRALTRCDDAVGLGLGLVSLNLRFVPFDLCGFAARNRSVFQPVGDAVLLVLLASVNAWSLCLRISD